MGEVCSLSAWHIWCRGRNGSGEPGQRGAAPSKWGEGAPRLTSAGRVHRNREGTLARRDGVA